MIKFYKGVHGNYNENQHKEGIYFTIDTDEIITLGNYYGKDADKSKTTRDIIVAGGPLADDLNTWPDEEGWTSDGNKVIPQGTSIQTLLEKLFLKTVDGTVVWGNVSWNPTLANPTVTLSKDDNIEVGTEITANVTSTSTVNNNNRSATCTASLGYFDTVDGSYESGDKTVSKSGSSSGTLSVTYTWNDTTVSNFTNNSTKLKVKSGTNKLVVSLSGITASVDALPSTTVYASTNTKTVLSNVSATLNDNASVANRTKALTSSGEDSITGKYRYFIGEVDAINGDASNLTSDMIRGLITSGKSDWMTTSQISYTVNHNISKGFVVACPATNQIEYIKDDAAVFEGGFTKKTMNVKDAGGTDVSYNVYYCNNDGSKAAVYKFFKFK